MDNLTSMSARAIAALAVHDANARTFVSLTGRVGIPGANVSFVVAKNGDLSGSLRYSTGGETFFRIVHHVVYGEFNSEIASTDAREGIRSLGVHVTTALIAKLRTGLNSASMRLAKPIRLLCV